MIPEIDSAARFLSSIIHRTIIGRSMTTEQMAQFQRALVAAFQSRCDGHWFPERPLRGSAYRCIRIVNNVIDRDIATAGTAAGLTESTLRKILPPELTLWIDPDEVSYRIGEEGSVGVIYNSQEITTTTTDEDETNANVTPPSPNKIRVSPDTVNTEYRHILETSSRLSSFTKH